MNFGQRFQKYRKAKNVSGWVLEKETGFSRSNLSSMEAGRYVPSDDVLKEIAQFKPLGLTYTDLRAWKALDAFTLCELKRATEIR